MLIIYNPKLIKLNLFGQLYQDIFKMKKILLYSFGFILLLSCSDSGTRYKNPYLPNYTFSVVIDENLPTYSGLKSPINPVYINDGQSGVSGLIVMRISATDYRAWESSCPNQYPSACSTMKYTGSNAKCDCEDYTYSLFTGIGDGEYTMKPYRVEVISPTSIRIYN